jgi:alpha-glucosidase (family GH31 glycosyl hydrolase)
MDVVYPDFASTNAQEWTTGLYQNLSHILEFDGFMLVKNDPIDDSEYTEPSRDVIPYMPSLNDGRPMMYESLPWTVVGAESQGNPTDVQHWKRHNEYGASHLRAVVNSVKTLKPEERPFVTSETGNAMSLKWGGFTGGRYTADWAALRKSVTHVLKAGLLGQPFAG